MIKLNEKQLRYLSRAIHQDIRGKNPYERKNIFKFGKNICDYIVKGVQFVDDKKLYDEINWNNCNTPYLENYDSKEIKFYFRTDMFKKSNMVKISKKMTEVEIYILIADLQDEELFNQI